MPRGAAVPRPADLSGLPQHGGGPPPARGPAVSNGRIAIVMLMVAETMLFSTLVGGYIVLRGAGAPWPPPGQPRLPLGVTWANTFVLLASCVTMWRGWRALARKEARPLRLSLAETALLGSAFLAIQGGEWVRLVGFGLTPSAHVYGATFYTLIGLHGLHVLAAVVWLLWAIARVRGDRFSFRRARGLDLCALYWFYVCGLWAFLFPLVYLY